MTRRKCLGAFAERHIFARIAFCIFFLRIAHLTVEIYCSVPQRYVVTLLIVFDSDVWLATCSVAWSRAEPFWSLREALGTVQDFP